MIDIDQLRAAWEQPDPPTPAAHAAARAALMQQIAGVQPLAPVPPPARSPVLPSLQPQPQPQPQPQRRRRVRLGWLAGAVTGAAAVSAAVALAVSPATTPPAQHTGQAAPTGSGQLSSQAVGAMSGRQVLLAAADVADTQPARTGKYWHFKESERDPATGKDFTQDTWIGPDGTRWYTSSGMTGVGVDPSSGFSVARSRLTPQEFAQLPTDPAKLTAWVTNSTRQEGDIPAESIPGEVAGALSDLLWRLPAPSPLRAAAYRALAAMPNVTNLGPANGGVLLRISFPPPPADKWPGGKRPPGTGELKLVVDPATATLRSMTNYQGTDTLLAVGWTNDLPKVTGPPSHS